MTSKSSKGNSPANQPKISVALPKGKVKDKLLGLLDESTVDVESENFSGDLLNFLESSDSDLVVIRKSQLSEKLLKEGAIENITNKDDVPDVVVLSEEAQSGERSRLVSMGVSRVINPNLPDEELQEKIEALATVASEGGLDGPETGGDTQEPRLADFMSRSPRMSEFLKTVERVVSNDSTLLITGETGVGKERLARAIHNESLRLSQPFISVNCGAISENLLESELFGHVQGAFTGAQSDRKGFFELADGGTLFLDEIGDMPKVLQVKLLTAIQRREIQRLGDEQLIKIDVRIMAATNKDLEEAVREGDFREDLFYRLNVMPLEIPPLRERLEDLPELIGNFIRYFRRALNKDSVSGMSDDALAVLSKYDFPGNIRELLNIVERSMLMTHGTVISLGDLPEEVIGQIEDRSFINFLSESVETDTKSQLKSSVELNEKLLNLSLKEAKQIVTSGFEEAYLRGLLLKTKGVMNETAKLAGITTRSLYEKMKKYDLDKKDFKE